MDKILSFVLGNPQVLQLILGMFKVGTTSPTTEPDALFTAKQLQEDLNKLGYPVAVSGKYDEATKLAVQNFQHANKLVEDGWAGIKTYAILFTQLSK